jgi:hypothetical protein
MSEHPATDGVILTHATLAALTPLIPLPFVDTAARNRVMRRMVRSLAELHHLRIWDGEVQTLADEESGSFFKGIAKGAVLAPLKFILRKTFMFLAGKRIVDLASQSYHHGFLMDRVFAHRWCTPAGKHTPIEIRKAIDEVLANEPVASSPVTRALRIGFEESRSALFDAYTSLRARFSGGGVQAAIDGAAQDDRGLEGVIAALEHALTDVPREHFLDLERKLRIQLFGAGGEPEIIVREVEDE